MRAHRRARSGPRSGAGGARSPSQAVQADAATSAREQHAALARARRARAPGGTRARPRWPSALRGSASQPATTSDSGSSSSAARRTPLHRLEQPRALGHEGLDPLRQRQRPSIGSSVGHDALVLLHRDRLEERLAVGEVLEDRALGDAGALGDPLGGGRSSPSSSSASRASTSAWRVRSARTVRPSRVPLAALGIRQARSFQPTARSCLYWPRVDSRAPLLVVAALCWRSRSRSGVRPADHAGACSRPGSQGTKQTYDCRYGPDHGRAVPGADQGDPSSTSPKPDVDGFVTNMDVDVVDADGTPVPISRLMLHHIVFLEPRQCPDRTCVDSFTTWDTMTELPAVAERFYAAGEERAEAAAAGRATAIRSRSRTRGS